MENNLTDKELAVLKQFEARFGKVENYEDIELLSKSLKILKKIHISNKKEKRKNQLNKEMYDTATLNIISKFEAEFGVMCDINYYLSLVQLHDAFVVKSRVFYKETEEGFEEINLSEIFEDNLNLAKKLNVCDDDEFEDRIIERNRVRAALCDVLNAIKKLGETTATKVFKEKFDVTVAEIADMLELTEGYITRNLMNEFISFNMNQHARFYIKSSYNNIDYNFINKKIFVSRKSFDDFIQNKIKYTDFKKQIQLDFSGEQKVALASRFKKEEDIKKAIKKAIAILDDSYVKTTPKRKDQAKYPLSEELLDKIYSDDYKMMSMKALRLYYENQAREELKSRPDYEEKEYKFVSYNDYQVYYNKLNKMTFARLVVDGVKSKSSQYGTQTKTIVRYLVPKNMISITREPLRETDNLYSLFNITYKNLASQLPENIEKTEENINNYIKKEIYNIMLDSSFEL